MRITDLFLKWTKVWVTERTSTEAAEMAGNYLRARKQQKDGRRQQEGKPWAIAKSPRESGKNMDSSPKPAVSKGGTHRSINGRRKTPESIATIVERRVTFTGTVPAMRCAAWNGRK